MATTLAKIASLPTNQTQRFFSINLLRSFSTSPTRSSSPSSPSSKKPKRKKKKNLFEVAQFLPNWGVGFHMAKSHWTNVSYQLTKINLYRDDRHGKAWGIAYKDGSPIADAPKKISGVHKRCWRYITKLKESESNVSKFTETVPKAEVQAA